MSWGNGGLENVRRRLELYIYIVVVFPTHVGVFIAGIHHIAHRDH